MDIWNDDRRLASRVNNMKAVAMIGGQRGRHVSLRADSFSGVKTIGLIWMRENTPCRFDIEMEVISGRAKLILVRKNSVATLISESCKQSKIIKLEKGFNRIRIVGAGATIKLRAEITKGVTFLEE